MQQQIASFLFQHKACPLPGLGTLRMHSSAAVSDFSNKLFIAPQHSIHFELEETAANEFLNYLSFVNGYGKQEAGEVLQQFCDGLKQSMHQPAGAHIEQVGTFLTNNSGSTSFKEELLPAAFSQPVYAERVIHPDAEHQILVGDKETTNTVMTELLAPKETTKDRWWAWAIVLAVVALSILLIYFTQFKGAYPFGNVIQN